MSESVYCKWEVVGESKEIKKLVHDMNEVYSLIRNSNGSIQLKVEDFEEINNKLRQGNMFYFPNIRSVLSKINLDENAPITWEALCFIRWKVLNDEDFRRNNVKKDFYFKSLLPANKIYTWQDYFRFYEDDYGRKFENDSFYKEIKKENIKFICRERDWYYNIWQNNVKVRNSEAAIEYGGFKVESSKEFTDDLEVLITSKCNVVIKALNEYAYTGTEVTFPDLLMYYANGIEINKRKYNSLCTKIRGKY